MSSSLLTPTISVLILIRKGNAIRSCLLGANMSSLLLTPAISVRILIGKDNVIRSCLLGANMSSSLLTPTISEKSGSHWFRDLTVDGDVESNPGPQAEFINLEKLYHISCADIPHKCGLHPVKRVCGYMICSCLDHHRIYTGKIHRPPLDSVSQVPPCPLPIQSYLFELESHVQKQTHEIKRSEIIDFVSSKESNYVPLCPDDMFSKFLQYHKQCLEDIGNRELPVLPLISSSLSEPECQTYRICNRCMLPGHKFSFKK
ncbi:hypothetical protein GEMRC1_005214 [Eukaryota sp. GEM-RC1]